MATSAQQMRAYKGPALFSFGFRPFFLGGALVAGVVPIIMALTLSGAVTLDFSIGVIAWHGHEMVYGYLGAVIAGFILTAVPNWTGRLPIVGARLVALGSIWLMGRAAMFFADSIGAVPAAMIDIAFLLVLDLVIWREVLTGKNWRNVPICILILLLAMGNLAWHIDIVGGGAGTTGLHWGLGVVSLLISLIGGRVTPSFTRNWLVKNGQAPIEAVFDWIDKIGIAVLAVGVALWLVAPSHMITGGFLLAAGLLHFARLYRWQGWRARKELSVIVLHIGYLWLALSLVLMGMAILSPGLISASAALHALTAGTAGGMTLAVMTRAVLGHTGRPISADRATALIFALVNLGALLRVGAAWAPADYVTMIGASSLVWSLAFILFALVYGRYMVTPRL